MSDSKDRGNGCANGGFTRYDIYDAIVTIVTNHYRPREDDSELDARKTLTLALAKLAIDDQ